MTPATRNNLRLAWDAITTLHALINEAAGLAPHPADADLNAPPDVGCDNHGRAGMWAAPSTRSQGWDLCEWCAAQVRQTGQWPHQAWLDAHERGDMRALRRFRTAALNVTEVTGPDMSRATSVKRGWFTAEDLALGVREVG